MLLVARSLVQVGERTQRRQYVPLVLSTCTVSVSNAVVVVVSAVSMCSQKVRVALSLPSREW